MTHSFPTRRSSDLGIGNEGALRPMRLREPMRCRPAPAARAFSALPIFHSPFPIPHSRFFSSHHDRPLHRLRPQDLRIAALRAVGIQRPVPARGGRPRLHRPAPPPHLTPPPTP